MRRLLIALACGIGLTATACTADPEPPEDEPSPTASATAADAGADTGVSEEESVLPLQLGDCWGLQDEIMLDPIPCDEPHVYEVAGVIEGWDFERYEGGFEAGIEGDDAMMDACGAAATAYFGYDPVDEGIMVDYGEPKFWGHEDVVFCSAHSGPDVAYVRDEVTGSFADRGWR